MMARHLVVASMIHQVTRQGKRSPSKQSASPARQGICSPGEHVLARQGICSPGRAHGGESSRGGRERERRFIDTMLNGFQVMRFSVSRIFRDKTPENCNNNPLALHV